jgi:hypothetical protein
MTFANSHKVKGCGDIAEAQKTAFNFVFEVIRKVRDEKGKDSKIIHIHLTDSPPHHKSNSCNFNSYY